MIDTDAIRAYDEAVLRQPTPRLRTETVRIGLRGLAWIVPESNGKPSCIEDAEVVVAGAGPAGVLIAHLLAQRGHDVLVLERRDCPSPGATWNIARQDFQDLARLGAFDQKELADLITGDYNTGIFRILDNDDGSQEDFYFNEILNISIDETAFFRALIGKHLFRFRLGVCAELASIGREHAFVRVSGSSNGIIRCRLLIDARGWSSPLGALVHPRRELHSVFNILGVRIPRVPRQLDATGVPIGISNATYENEIKSTNGYVQPILMRFSDTKGPAEESGELLYYYTRTPRHLPLAPLVDEMLPRLSQIAPGFRDSDVRKTYYGHIPGYFPAPPMSPWRRQTSPGDHVLFVGCAAEQYSGLTGCAVGALVRNAGRICDAVDEALREGRLGFRDLMRVDISPLERAAQALGGLFAGIMVHVPGEPVGTVSRDWITFLRAAGRMDPGLRSEAFRDVIGLKTLGQMVRVCTGSRDAVAALIRINRGRIGMVVWTFLRTCAALLKHGLGFRVRLRRPGTAQGCGTDGDSLIGCGKRTGGE
ncbi:MAG: FAD-dependent monooxygenase [Planctomycetota bacterium]